jgi:hypothetical protein
LYYIPPAATDAELDSITASQDNVDPLPNFEDDEDGCVIPTGSLKHPARCDNCTKQVIGCRYKCANCRDFDFCEVRSNAVIYWFVSFLLDTFIVQFCLISHSLFLSTGLLH